MCGVCLEMKTVELGGSGEGMVKSRALLIVPVLHSVRSPQSAGMLLRAAGAQRWPLLTSARLQQEVYQPPAALGRQLSTRTCWLPRANGCSAAQAEIDNAFHKGCERSHVSRKRLDGFHLALIGLEPHAELENPSSRKAPLFSSFLTTNR